MHNRLIKITALAGLMIGSFAIAVMAESYTWTPPSVAAPNGNIPAPINVGGTHQYKEGSVALGGSTVSPGGFAFDVNGSGYFTGLKIAGSIVANELSATNLFVTGTNKDKSGYVLTNDGTGKAEWKSGSSQAILASDYCYATFAGRNVLVGAFKGYYLKGITKTLDGNWDGLGGVYCLSSGTTDSRMTNAIKNTIVSDSRYGPVVFRSIGKSYNEIVNDCNANKGSYGDHLNVCPALDPF